MCLVAGFPLKIEGDVFLLLPFQAGGHDFFPVSKALCPVIPPSLLEATHRDDDFGKSSNEEGSIDNPVPLGTDEFFPTFLGSFLGSGNGNSVPSEGLHALAGGSPAGVKAGSPVAWMAGGDGNVAF